MQLTRDKEALFKFLEDGDWKELKTTNAWLSPFSPLYVVKVCSIRRSLLTDSPSQWSSRRI